MNRSALGVRRIARCVGFLSVLAILVTGLSAPARRPVDLRRATPIGLSSDVLLPVPTISQNDPRWANLEFSTPERQNQSFGGCGCFLAAWSMVLRYEFGDPSTSGGTTPWFPTFVSTPNGHRQELSWNPVYVDSFLAHGRTTPGGQQVGGNGYAEKTTGSNCGGIVNWWALEDVGLPAFAAGPDGQPEQITPSGISIQYHKGFARDAIDAALAAGRPSVVTIRNPESGAGHAYLIVGWDARFGGYVTLNNPGDGPSAVPRHPGIPDPDNRFATTRDQYNTWESWIKMTMTYGTVDKPSTFRFSLTDDPAPVEFSLLHPDGRRTGYDPATGEHRSEVPGAAYADQLGAWADPSGRTPPGTPGKLLVTPATTTGTHRFQVTGTGTGSATYSLAAWSPNGDKTELLNVHDDTVSPGEVRKFELHGVPGGESTAEEVASFSPDARAGNDVAGLTGVRVDFDAGRSAGTDGTIVSYRWDFGDGTTATASHPRANHIYETPGVYQVTVTVTDNLGGQSTDTLAASISSATPIADGKLTHLVSLADGESQDFGASREPALSRDGRFVAFTSDAALAPGDWNGVGDIYVRDLHAGTTDWVSVSTTGQPFIPDPRRPWERSDQPDISSDGRYVVFRTPAKFATHDTNGAEDIYLRDRATRVTELVSVAPAGTAFGGHHPRISADGRYVVFMAGDGTGTYVRDRVARTTEPVRLAASGQPVGGPHVDLSADGRVIAFLGHGSGVVAGVDSIWSQVYVHDRTTGRTELLSATPSGGPGNHYSSAPALSADGRYVAFESTARDLVGGGDANGDLSDVLVRDRVTGTTERVSVSTGGLQGNHHSVAPSISADGRYVAFESQVTNLVPDDANGTGDVFLRDRQSGTTERISVSSAGAEMVLAPGTPASVSLDVDVAGDGSAVVFASSAANLVAGDRNSLADVFVRHQLDPKPVANPSGPYIGWADSAENPSYITLFGGGTDLYGGALTATWDFGDGSPPVTSQSLTVQHAYAAPGEYTVTLTVDNGTAVSEPISTTATVLPPVPSDSTTVSPSCAAAGSTIAVTGYSREANTALIRGGRNLAWGALTPRTVTVTGPGIAPQSVMPKLPSLQVATTVALPADLAGGTYPVRVGTAPPDTLTVPCPAGNAVPIADAGGPYRAAVGEAVRLDGLASADAENDPLTYRWDLGDGASAAGATPLHAYDEPGTYVVHLVVNDGTNDSVGFPGDASFAVVTVVTIERAATQLEADPVVLKLTPFPRLPLPGLRATLRHAGSGVPLPGREVVFAVRGGEVCRAVTDVVGLARCGGVAESLNAALSGGFTATFAGDAANLPSSGFGPVIRV